MGQYWKLINLDKKEYVNPHELGSGLKLIEQLGTFPGIGSAMIILTAAMPERRGGGDFYFNESSKIYQIAKKTVGRWAGDRIALIGDYSEDGDMGIENPDKIYTLCITKEEYNDDEEYFKRNKIYKKDLYKDISDNVAAIIENQLNGKFVGDGWKDWETSKTSNKREIKCRHCNKTIII